jgi:acetyl esterase/lipase
VYYALGNKDISKTPTVVLIHGSAPDDNLKDSSVYTTWGKKIASSGFNAVMFNWRPSNIGDVSDLIIYIRENTNQLEINSKNISVIAFSAGVYEGVKEAMEVNTGFIKNVAVYYGYINSSILTSKTNVKLPSFFIAMAALDNAFPPNINDNFIKKAQEAGSNVVKMVHSKAGHGFDAFNANSFETKLIIDKTLKFIENGSN